MSITAITSVVIIGLFVFFLPETLWSYEAGSAPTVQALPFPTRWGHIITEGKGPETQG